MKALTFMLKLKDFSSSQKILSLMNFIIARAFAIKIFQFCKKGKVKNANI